MGTRTETLEVKITASDQASGVLKSIGDSVTGIGKKLTAGVTLPLTVLGGIAVNAASDLDESMNKVAVVFGEAGGEIREFAKGAAENLGITQQEALEAAGTFGNLFTAMEIGVDESSEMSQGILTLAADLASFNNIDPTVALEKLRAGLVGEVEPLRTLGVNLSAATVEAKAMEMGLVPLEKNIVAITEAELAVKKAQEEFNEAMKEHGAGSDEVVAASVKHAKAFEKLEKAQRGTAGELTAAAKSQAAYALIMEQTTTAQGDFERTSDGLANSMRIVKAQVMDLAAQFGTFLLPFVQQAVDFFRDLMKRLQALTPEQQKMILMAAGIAAALGPVLIIVGTLISTIGAIIPVIGAVVGVLSGPLLLVIGLVIGAIALLVAAWRNNWFGIREIVANAIERIKALIQTGLDFIRAFWAQHGEQIMAVVNQFVEFIKANVAAFLELLKQWWDEHGESVVFIVTTLWEGLKTVFSAAFDFLKTVVSVALAALMAFWDNHGAAIMEIASNTWETIKETIKSILSIIGSIVEAFSAALRGDWEAFGQHLQDAAQTAWDAIANIIDTVGDNIVIIVGETITAIIDWWEGIDWEGIGKNMMEAVKRGIEAGAQLIIDAAKKAAQKAYEAVLDFLGIGSDSKLYIEIGSNLMSSLASGIDQTARIPAASTVRATRGLTSGAISTVSTSGDSSIRNITRGGDTIYITNSAAAELYFREKRIEENQRISEAI